VSAILGPADWTQPPFLSAAILRCYQQYVPLLIPDFLHTVRALRLVKWNVGDCIHLCQDRVNVAAGHVTSQLTVKFFTG
jgi:hypothetical protein